MENKMEKRYGLPTAISMVIGIVIGSGVFIKGGKVLSLTGGNLLQGIAVVGIVGLICIICSLVFATLGSKYEKVNGVVDYAELALGSKYAYYVGWFMTTIYTPALASMLAFFSAMMFLQLFGISSIDFANGQVNAVAIGVGAGFLMIGYGINALSPKIAGKLQVGMTVIKLIPLILMGVAGTIAGLVNGTTANTFSPNAIVTRAQVVTVLYRMAGSPSVKGMKCPFADNTAAWSRDAITWAYNAGVANGFTDSRFAGSATVTREQLAAFLFRYADKVVSGGTLKAPLSYADSFSDASSVSAYAVPAMRWANVNGIINGRTGGILDPTGSATRAEFTCMISRFSAAN